MSILAVLKNKVKKVGTAILAASLICGSTLGAGAESLSENESYESETLLETGDATEEGEYSEPETVLVESDVKEAADVAGQDFTEEANEENYTTEEMVYVEDPLPADATEEAEWQEYYTEAVYDDDEVGSSGIGEEESSIVEELTSSEESSFVDDFTAEEVYETEAELDTEDPVSEETEIESETEIEIETESEIETDDSTLEVLETEEFLVDEEELTTEEPSTESPLDIDNATDWTGKEKVTALKAASTVNGSVLTWSKVPNADGYLIGAIQNGNKYKQIGFTTNTTYTDKDASLTIYSYYWVFPYKKVKEKVIRGQISGQYVYGIKQLPQPKDVKVQSRSASVYLSWSAVSGADGYIIKVRRGNGEVVQLADLSATSYSDTKADSEITSFYWVYAYKKYGTIRRPGATSSYVYGKATQKDSKGTVSIPDGNGMVGDSAYEGNRNITKIILPYGIKSIGKRAFANSSLTEINLPSSITYIADDAFSGCSDRLRIHVIPDSYPYNYCKLKGLPAVMKSNTELKQGRDKLNTDIKQIEKKYYNTGGYVPLERGPEVLQEVGAKLKQACSEGIIMNYHIGDYSASYSDVLQHHGWVYIPKFENALASGKSLKLDLYTFEQNLDEFGLGTHTARQSIVNKIKIYKQSGNYTPDNISLDDFSRIGDNQIILWYGHGGTWFWINNKEKNDYSVICTAIPFSNEYDIHCKTDQENPPWFVRNTDNDTIVLTPFYFEEILKEKTLNNTMIYMGSCFSSGENLYRNFADVFVGKGATVVGFSKLGQPEYVKDLLNEIVYYFINVNPKTGRHYTLEDALKNANSDLVGDALGGWGKKYYNEFYLMQNRHSYSLGSLEGDHNYSPWPGKLKGTIYGQENNQKTPVNGSSLTITGGYLKTPYIVICADGKFQFELPKGTYQISAAGPGYTSSEKTTIEIGSDSEKTIDFTLIKSGIILSPNPCSVKVGSSTKISARFNGNASSIIWSSDNPSVATVSSGGYVTGIAEGIANIKASTGTDYAICEVTVFPDAKLYLDYTGFNCVPGDSRTLKCTVSGTTQIPVWESSNPEVATVDQNGKVTAKSAGSANITAKIGEAKATCSVSVSSPKISLDHRAIVGIGKTLQLEASVNSISSKPTWSSRNTKIAMVDANGKVTGKASGVTTITVSLGGVSAYCEVTVVTDRTKIKSAGEYFTFGNFYQDKEEKGEFAKTPIVWKVLSVSNGKAMAVSQHILWKQKFNETNENVLWTDCSLRTWLNSTFLNIAFSASEQKKIIETKNTETINNSSGNDRVFLLSSDEVKMYFPESADRSTSATYYSYRYNDYWSVNSSMNWWTRTVVKSSQVKNSVTVVSGYKGTLYNVDATEPYFYVRPAITVKISD